MNFAGQFALILLITFLGECLRALISLPIPAGIYGIVLMFLALEFKLIKVSAVRETGLFLVEIMPMMFIPAAVGLIGCWDVLRPSWLAYMAITVISTFAVMLAAGKVTQALLNRQQKTEGQSHE